MKNLLFFKNLIICSTLFVSALASADGAGSTYKMNEVIPVQAGTEVVWRNWKSEYVNHTVGQEFHPDNRARTTYLNACADIAKYQQLCESFYQDSTLMRYVYVSTPGTCAERAAGQPAVCVGDLVKSLHGPLQVRVAGIGSGVHFNSKTGAYSRFVMTQDLEYPAHTVVHSQNINEVWLLNR
ncbi:hypothetical protein D3C87_1338700 [compost metagenome]